MKSVCCLISSHVSCRWLVNSLMVVAVLLLWRPCYTRSEVRGQFSERDVNGCIPKFWNRCEVEELLMICPCCAVGVAGFGIHHK